MLPDNERADIAKAINTASINTRAKIDSDRIGAFPNPLLAQREQS